MIYLQALLSSWWTHYDAWHQSVLPLSGDDDGNGGHASGDDGDGDCTNSDDGNGDRGGDDDG